MAALALSGKFKDFEDALPEAGAVAGHCDLIITRNVGDFKPSRIPVISPGEFLLQGR